MLFGKSILSMKMSGGLRGRLLNFICIGLRVTMNFTVVLMMK